MAFAYNLEANDELWRECAQWLTQWELIRPDHRVNLPDSRINHFANILRDGVLLCKLLNKIDPGCIDMKSINLKPTMARFLCIRNIRTFLQTCQSSFNLKQNDLFDEAMLFDLTNFHKVLCTLSKVSLHPKALRTNIRGFNVQKENTREEDEIYQSLQTEEMTPRPRSVTEEYEDIYHEILIDRLGASRKDEQTHTYEKRDFVINELLDTEKNYVEVLTNLKKNFMIPLYQYLNDDDMRTIFCNIEELHEIHSAFYSELVQIRNPTPGTQPPKLSSIFMKYRDKFLAYGQYCANLQHATSRLQELCDNSEHSDFNNEVAKCEKMDNNGRFKLRDVLSVPMQRILKYHLLLEKLIENTSNNHEEYIALTRTREIMLDVAGYINEAARDSDNATVIKNVQQSIGDWVTTAGDLPCEEYGRLLKDCDLRMKYHENSRPIKSRYVFIFETCIIVCKQQSKGFSFREIIRLRDFHVEDGHQRQTLQRDLKMMNQFHLVRNDQSSVITVFVRTEDLKRSLMKILRDALDNLKPAVAQRTNHQLEYTTFKKPTTCHFCSKYLRGLIYQGYRCTSCGDAFHKQCIANLRRCMGHARHSRMHEHVPAPGLAPSPPPVPPPLNEAHGDDPLRHQLWFVGEMDRQLAETKLRGRKRGTYLVRIRPKSREQDRYALSLKTDGTMVKHMKIMCTEPSNSDSVKYYLSPSKYFNSIEELIINYQHYSLRENFERLAEDTILHWPYRQLVAIVIESFNSDDDHELSLTEGEEVFVIGREGYRDGWLKGYNKDDKVGYFPEQNVSIDREAIYD